MDAYNLWENNMDNLSWQDRKKVWQYMKRADRRDGDRAIVTLRFGRISRVERTRARINFYTGKDGRRETRLEEVY